MLPAAVSVGENTQQLLLQACLTDPPPPLQSRMEHIEGLINKRSHQVWGFL